MREHPCGALMRLLYLLVADLPPDCCPDGMANEGGSRSFQRMLTTITMARLREASMVMRYSCICRDDQRRLPLPLLAGV